MSNYPDNCIRGLKSEDWRQPNSNLAASCAFHFDYDSQREDNCSELSINWEDDNKTVQFTLNQKRQDGKPQFKIGVVRLPTNDIDLLNTKPACNGTLSYERRPLDDNPHHGNILLSKTIDRKIMKSLIAPTLAMHSSPINTSAKSISI